MKEFWDTMGAQIYVLWTLKRRTPKKKVIFTVHSSKKNFKIWRKRYPQEA